MDSMGTISNVCNRTASLFLPQEKTAFSVYVWVNRFSELVLIPLSMYGSCVCVCICLKGLSVITISNIYGLFVLLLHTVRNRKAALTFPVAPSSFVC